MLRFGPPLTFVITAMVVLGCSSGVRRPPTYQVTGTVTMKGQPVESATVVFVPAEGATHEPATGITDAAGKFKLSTFMADDGAQDGEYRIKVSKFDLKKPTKEEQQRYVSLEEEQKMQFGEDKPTPPAKNVLPPKYANEATSGFTYAVTKKGPNAVDLKLE
jgi:hypothetical protein